MSGGRSKMKTKAKPKLQHSPPSLKSPNLSYKQCPSDPTVVKQNNEELAQSSAKGHNFWQADWYAQVKNKLIIRISLYRRKPATSTMLSEPPCN